MLRPDGLLGTCVSIFDVRGISSLPCSILLRKAQQRINVRVDTVQKAGSLGIGNVIRFKESQE